MGIYEIVEETGNPLKNIHYLSAPNGLFAIYTKMENGQDEMNYILKDHLGSIHFITDENGNPLEELGFDAWGNHRNPQTWTKSTLPQSYKFDRGFTLHEHLDEFGLINMNGRMYDPLVCRFLSPDPYTSSITDLQQLNKYSYVTNNPLKYFDPSGYFGEPQNMQFDEAIYSLDYLLETQLVDYTQTYWEQCSDIFGSNSSNEDGLNAQDIYDWALSYMDETGTDHVKISFQQNGKIEVSYTWVTIMNDSPSPDVANTAVVNNITRVFDPSGQSQEAGSDGGGVDATPYVGEALGVVSEVMFSDKFGTWMGKDGKIRSQDWGGNGTTGGKYKFAGKVSKGFKIGGWVFGAYGINSTNMEWQNNQISTRDMVIQQISNVLGFIPTYGTAWSIGWNLGQDFGPSTWYGKNDYKWFE